jgi:F-type H+-transporting ATPase subunit alpha
MPSPEQQLREWSERAKARLAELEVGPRFEYVGTVEDVGDGVAFISGLPGVRLDEILSFPGGARGLALQMDRERIGCAILDAQQDVAAGDEVRGTGQVVEVPVGPELLGRVVDPLGRPLDDGPEIQATERYPVERPAPGILDHALVRQPLQTGILAIDSMIPVGRGQRELIIGDRKTGKTAIAVDTVINQRDTDVVSVYAVIGQKASTTREIIESIQTYGDPSKVTFVVGGADSAPATQWLTAYAACSIAEWFRDHGRDALVIYDDLSKQADAYRELSLLLRRPPGREAFPGDIFYIQSRLLERAANVRDEAGGGSLTALPIAETRAGNISAYIPTNLISITDGQIYLDPDLFNRGQKPAIDIGKSVSRVGGKTQTQSMQDLASDMRLRYTQFLELEEYTRFGVEMDPKTQARIEHGRRIRAILSQPRLDPLGASFEVTLLLALNEHVLDDVPLDNVRPLVRQARERLKSEAADVLDRIDETGQLTDDDRSAILDVFQSVARRFRSDDAEEPRGAAQ